MSNLKKRAQGACERQIGCLTKIIKIRKTKKCKERWKERRALIEKEVERIGTIQENVEAFVERQYTTEVGEY